MAGPALLLSLIFVWMVGHLSQPISASSVVWVEENDSVTIACPVLKKTKSSTWFKSQSAKFTGSVIYKPDKTWMSINPRQRPDLSIDNVTFSLTIGRVQIEDDAYFWCSTAPIIETVEVGVYINPKITWMGRNRTLYPENTRVTFVCSIERVYPTLKPNDFKMRWGTQPIEPTINRTCFADKPCRYTAQYTRTLTQDDDGTVVNCTVTPTRKNWNKMVKIDDSLVQVVHIEGHPVKPVSPRPGNISERVPSIISGNSVSGSSMVSVGIASGFAVIIIIIIGIRTSSIIIKKRQSQNGRVGECQEESAGIPLAQFRRFPLALSVTSPPALSVTPPMVTLPYVLSASSAPALSVTSPTALSLTPPSALSITSSPALTVTPPLTSPAVLSVTSAPSFSVISPTTLCVTSPPALSVTSTPALSVKSLPALSVKSAPVTAPPAVSVTSTSALSVTSSHTLSVTSPPALSVTMPSALFATTPLALSVTSPLARPVTSPPVMSPPALSVKSPTALSVTSPSALSVTSPPVYPTSATVPSFELNMSPGGGACRGRPLIGRSNGLTTHMPISTPRETPIEYGPFIKTNIERVRKEVAEMIMNDMTRNYQMRSNPRGKAILLSIDNFTNVRKDRPGSDKDVVNLNFMFTELGFQVETWSNLTAQGIRARIQKEQILSLLQQYDAFVMCVFSHGNKGTIQDCECRDMDIMEELLKPFNAVNAPGLAHKPKMFFIQACQAEKKHNVETDSVDDNIVHVMPCSDGDVITGLGSGSHEMADFLLVHSALEGYPSYRHIGMGSFFIRDLVSVIRERCHQDHMADMMIEVTNRLNARNMGRLQQICSTKSTLTRRVFLLPGYSPCKPDLRKENCFQFHL